MNSITKKEIFEWIEEQQEAGEINIFQYPSFIRQIWDISKQESRNIFIEWKLCKELKEKTKEL